MVKKEKITYKLIWSGIYPGYKSHLSLYKDSWGKYWLDLTKNKYSTNCLGSFYFSDEDVERLNQWANRPVESIEDRDSIRITCGCISKCSIIEFEIDKTKDGTLNVFVEYYIHCSYRKNFTRKMAAETYVSLDSLKDMFSRIAMDKTKKEKKV